MTICDLCGKKMPPHILEAHLKKTHGIEEAGKVASDAKKRTEPFDWGEVQECNICHDKLPIKFMRVHVKVIHGL